MPNSGVSEHRVCVVHMDWDIQMLAALLVPEV